MILTLNIFAAIIVAIWSLAAFGAYLVYTSTGRVMVPRPVPALLTTASVAWLLSQAIN